MFVKANIPEIDKIFNEFPSQGPGVAVHIIKDEKAIHTGLRGLADLKSQTSIDLDTSFRLASVSKQFTAMAIAILMERETLKLDEYVKDILEGWPAYAGQVTVKNLIYHTSGLPDYTDDMKFCTNVSDDPKTSKVTNQVVLDYLKTKKKLLFPTGTSFKYNNTGYVLLSSIIAIKSKMSFPEFIHREIFSKLNMKESRIYSYDTMMSNVAKGYEPQDSQGTEGTQAPQNPYIEVPDNTCSYVYGDGGIFSSVNDFKKWIFAVQNSTLVSEKTTNLIFSYGQKTDKENTDYGFGWYLSKKFNRNVIYHQGGWVGFKTMVIYIPSDKIWIMMFSNNDSASMKNLSKKVLSVLLK